ncbi:chloride channel protein 2-like [Rhynchophorus ferrugineus]|uniref:Chloride channel protein n=1 Tax=Rhynchophorus ferrugineus TaxID=354439 RepID=A0A834IT53_RHYFE|nr:hypothetical protein GWI33_004658 [Rhynchophorus ferrugineus]
MQSGKSKYLPESQVYDSKYSTVQYYNKSLEDLYASLKEKKQADKRKQKELEKTYKLELHAEQGTLHRAYSKLWTKTFGHFGEDWIFLAVLGICVAIISYTIDQGVAICSKARMMLYAGAANNYVVKWAAWVGLPLVLILWDTGYVSILAPKAVGSGVPQIKTCLRGVYLKEYLTFKVLLTKWWGIMATLASGMPMGKEGPLIQMSSILVTKMSKFLSNFKSVYLNENKKIELIGAAYAVGVACTFNAPIGGVLFSVEISTAYYAVRNYWRGFFAAVWGAAVYRLLYVWINGVDTIRVVYPTHFLRDFPYDPMELFSFALLGVICGIGGSSWIFCARAFSQWSKKNKYINWIKNQNRFAYPCIIILLVSTMSFPLGTGQFIAAEQTANDQVIQLFSNFTWSSPNHTAYEHNILNNWTTRYTGFYTNLLIYFAFQFVASILGSTLPIPTGTFTPNFRSGAVFGRILGELLSTWFPNGIRSNGKRAPILPGAYATVGAAAYSGAVTHTLSTSVILFEMTSQISYVIPVLISNLIANGIARLFTPSVYDLTIQQQKLPYLPDLLPSSSAIYQFFVEDFMIKEVKYLYLGCNYAYIKELLKANKHIKVFPLVDNAHNMILLGSISKAQLVRLIESQIGYEKRLEIAKINEETTVTEEPKPNENFEEVRQRIFDKYKVNKIIGSELSQKKKQILREQLFTLRICDLPFKEQKVWEENQLSQEVDFSQCYIDPAPFQLVERTSLLKVHSLFSMMSINTSYVTAIGKLVGVVGLKELRKAIEDANSGISPNQRLNGEHAESVQLMEQK